MNYNTIRTIKNNLPAPLKNFIRALKLQKLVWFCYNKPDIELSYQRKWAQEFAAQKHKVLEYWKHYRFLDNIERLVGFTDKSKVIDVGCGISTVLHFVKGRRFGIDPLAQEYKELYDYPRDITVLKSCGEEIPFKDAYFDVAFCSNVLDHVKNPRTTIDEIHRILAPDGFFIMTVELFERAMPRDPAHPHCFLKNDVCTLLGHKFKIIFEKESPWISEKNYIDGIRQATNKELILVCKKIA